jgi:hypothetical protein
MGRSLHCNLTVADLWLDDGWVTGGQFLRVSLKQAIEIHAQVLKYRFGRLAPEMAREKALSCSASKDHEGHHPRSPNRKTSSDVPELRCAFSLPPTCVRAFEGVVVRRLERRLQTGSTAFAGTSAALSVN